MEHLSARRWGLGKFLSYNRAGIPAVIERFSFMRIPKLNQVTLLAMVVVLGANLLGYFGKVRMQQYNFAGQGF